MRKCSHRREYGIFAPVERAVQPDRGVRTERGHRGGVSAERSGPGHCNRLQDEQAGPPRGELPVAVPPRTLSDEGDGEWCTDRAGGLLAPLHRAGPGEAALPCEQSKELLHAKPACTSGTCQFGSNYTIMENQDIIYFSLKESIIKSTEAGHTPFSFPHSCSGDERYH